MQPHNTLPLIARRIIKNNHIEVFYLYLVWLWGFTYKNNIGVNSRLNLYRQRWTIAHELWHFIKWHSQTPVWVAFWKSLQEKDADQFAMEVLLPKKDLMSACEDYEWDLNKLEIVFWVERDIIEKRIKQIFNF